MVRLLITLGSIVAIGMATARSSEHTKDSLDTVRANLQQNKAVLIDVREPSEWKQGHLHDASLVPLSEIRRFSQDSALLTKHTASLPKSRIIYLHCASGVRVISATHFLERMGYDVRPLAAGYSDLLEAGFRPAAKPR